MGIPSEGSGLDELDRPLSSAERRLMQNALRFAKRRARLLLSRSILASMLISGALWSLTIWASDSSPLIITGIWVGVAVLISLWTILQERPKLTSRVHTLEGALRRNQAHVLRIRSERMVEFGEQEDEGACYAFQLPGNRVVFVSGQDYYGSANFPNTDFSIVNILGQDGAIVERVILKDGGRLAPCRSISGDQKPQTMPRHLEVVSGSVDRIEELLKRLRSE